MSRVVVSASRPEHMPPAASTLRQHARNALYTAREALSMAGTRRATMQEFGPRPAPSAAEHHLEAAIAWLCRAQDACPEGGVSYGYDLRSGWNAAYPETTGYIIPTLFDCGAHRAITDVQAADLRDRAAKLARWLISVQLDSGAIPGGTVLLVPQPTVFNTGQVLDGWCRASSELRSDEIAQAARRAASWLASVQDDDGCWRRGLSPLTPKTPATYNVRSAAALLVAGELFDEPAWRAAAAANADWVLTQQHDNGWFENNCVTDNDRPLTHTIGYTLEGLLKFAVRPGGECYLTAVRRASDALLRHIGADGFLSGRFDTRWRPVVAWNCLTGASQLAMVWFHLGRITGEQKYVDAARRTLDFVKSTQRLSARRGEDDSIVGGIKGSHPTWGRYEPFAYPNWATKFFADAVIASLDVASAQPRRPAGAAEQATAAGLRVAYVVEDYPTFIVSEVAELRRLGADVTLLSAFRPQPEADPMKDAFRRESLYLPEKLRDVVSANAAVFARRPAKYASVIARLLRERESLRFALLGACHARTVRRAGITHLHGTFGTRTTTLAWVVSRLSGVGYSFTTHAYDIFCPNPSLPWKTNEAAFMRTISDFNRRYITDTFHGVNASRIRVVRMGVDTAVFRPSPRSMRTDAPRVVAIGTLIAKKGHEYLIEACADLARKGVRVDCRIVGDGPLRGRLEQAISANGLASTVRLLGNLPYADVLKELQHADLLALACVDARSVGEHMDGIPVALMEAMAMGLPVVTTPVSGVPELVESGVSGLLVPERNPAALASAIAQLATNPALRASMGQAARQTVIERYDLARNTLQLAQSMKAAS